MLNSGFEGLWASWTRDSKDSEFNRLVLLIFFALVVLLIFLALEFLALETRKVIFLFKGITRKVKWRGYKDSSRERRQLSGYGALTAEGVPYVRLHKKLSPTRVVEKAKAFGLRTSDEKHPERRKYVDFRDENGKLVASIVDWNVILLPRDDSMRKTGIAFINTLLE